MTEGPIAHETDPEGQSGVQATMQGVVDALLRELGGSGDPAGIRERLGTDLAAAGVPEQPQKWVADTAVELANGRAVIVDRRLRDVATSIADHQAEP